MTSFEYVDVVEINGPTGSVCSGTRVSETLVLTAAHCIGNFEGNTFIEVIKPGNMLGSLGVVVSTKIHPKYKEARLKRLQNNNDKLASKLSTLYDIAFIELKKRESKRTMPYPKVISDQNKPIERKKVELAGFGDQQLAWNGNNFRSHTKTSSLQIAENEWIECPIDYGNKSLKELEELNNSITEALAIRAGRTHYIIDGVEKLATDGKGMILSGDSGSPSLERGSDGSFIVTGVASNIVTYDTGSGSPELEITVDGKAIVQQKFEEMPQDWGLREKSDSSFTEITDVLKTNGLLDSDGKTKPGVQVKRSFVRFTKGHFSDLSHPENQSFIKSVMK